MGKRMMRGLSSQSLRIALLTPSVFLLLVEIQRANHRLKVTSISSHPRSMKDRQQMWCLAGLSSICSTSVARSLEQSTFQTPEEELPPLVETRNRPACTMKTRIFRGMSMKPASCHKSTLRQVLERRISIKLDGVAYAGDLAKELLQAAASAFLKAPPPSRRHGSGSKCAPLRTCRWNCFGSQSAWSLRCASRGVGPSVPGWRGRSQGSAMKPSQGHLECSMYLY